MLQLATFKVPEQQTECNDFLTKFKPMQGGINFRDNLILIVYENGVVSPADEIADLRELIKATKNANFNIDLALYVMGGQRADLLAEQSDKSITSNKKRINEIDGLLSKIQAESSQLTQNRSINDLKIEYVERLIKNIENGSN